MIKGSGGKLRDLHLMEGPENCCEATVQSGCHIYQTQFLVIAAKIK